MQADQVKWDADPESSGALPGGLGKVQVLLHSGCQYRGGHLQETEEVPNDGTGMAALSHE